MAEIGRRQEVQDPLALNPMRRDAERTLPTYGVRNPYQSGGDAATKQGLNGLNVIDGLQAIAGRIFERAAETSMTQGKLDHMAGATQAEMEAKGDKYATRGWQGMEAVNTANNWLTQEAQFIDEQGAQMDPADYNQRLMDSRAEAMKALPNDPQARALWAAAFEDSGPRLTRLQTEKHNEYNRSKSMSELGQLLDTGSYLNTDASIRVGDGDFRVSQEPVRTPVLNQTAEDRDLGIRTILGEAVGEGQQGMAAVAHSIVNRMGSARYGKMGVKDTVLASKQYSVWNGGTEGNAWNPESAQYKRAAQVWDAVTSGRHVDPTGGSTQYYSPSGMKDGKEPDWWKEESKNGVVKLGRHMFAVAGRPGNGPKGKLSFDNKGQDRIDGNFKSVLEEVAGEVGGNLRITSGYRSPNHTVERRKKNGGGEHTHGTASDIDMTGMDEGQRADLVDRLRAKGVKRFGTYDDLPNMLHVDMKDQKGDGSAWFMHNESNNNIKGAPAWFQKMYSSDDGGTRTQRRGTQVQATLDSVPGKPEDKAAVLSKSMQRALDAGDDGLFNDAGGVSYLYGLGASPQDITAVLKAKERFDTEQDKKFDLGKERAVSSFKAAVQAGEFGTEEEMGDALQILLDNDKLSDGEAKSLYRSVASDMQKGGDKIIPIEFRSMALDLFERVDGGAMTPEVAAQTIQEFGKKNGVKPEVLNTFMGNMFSKADERRKRVETEAKTLFKKQEKEEEVKKDVKQALVNGSGLATVKGTVTVPNERGKDVEVPAKEYGIMEIKNEAAKAKDDFLTQAIRPGMNADQIRAITDQAEVKFYEDVYAPLARQGVYDEKFGDQLGNAVRGTILNDKKEITEDAQKSVDVYMQMLHNPKIGPEYVAGMIKDEKARSFLSTVDALWDGRGDLGQAMLRANTILSQKVTPENKIELNTEFRIESGPLIKAALANQIPTDFWSRITGSDSTYSDDEATLAVARNAPLMENYVLDRAKAYQMANPFEPNKVSITKATEDLQLNTVIVGSNVILGDYRRGQRLDQVMGLEGMEAGKAAPQLAIRDWIDKTLPTDPRFEALWRQKTEQGMWSDAFGAVGLNTQPYARPHYNVAYSPIDGSVEITLYEDATRTKQVGPSIYPQASDIGSWYRKNVNEGQPTLLKDMWRGGVDNIANQVQSRNAAEAGAAIGAQAN